MRRIIPPQRLRIHQGAAPSVCALHHGAAGLSLLECDPPAGATVLTAPKIALSVASPYPTHGLSATAGGTMVMSWAPGAIQSIVLPDLAQAFDRRPPGACDARGAARANAALLRADDGWRGVVLPSMGDRISDLGPGPVAISANGLQIAIYDEGTTYVVALADGEPIAEYPGVVEDIAFASDRLWIAANGAVHPAGDTSAQTGSPVIALAGAGAANRVLARDADGRLTRYGAGEPAESWTPVITDITAISLSDDGGWATLSGPDAVAVVRATDGALALYIAGASAIALAFDGRVVIGGEWGMALIVPFEESV